MTPYLKDQEIKPKKLFLQNICGSVFILLFVTQLIIQSLLLTGVFDAKSSSYAYVLGSIAAIGFGVLVSLSSNFVSRIFATTMLCTELFFMCCRPLILSLTLEERPFFSFLYWACILFNVLSLYMWSLLFKNCRFRSADAPWIHSLMLPFFVNILCYGGFIEYFYGIQSVASLVVDNMWIVTIIRILFAFVLPVGYWRLSHSDTFSGYQYDHTFVIDFMPFNRYMLVTAIILTVFFLGF